MLAVQPLTTASRGAAARQTLVLLHGFLCGGLFFRPLSALMQPDYDMVTVDLPGFGDSHHCRATDSIDDMAQQVQQALAAAGYKNYHLLGHSMGGMVALQMALNAENAENAEYAPKHLHSLILYATNSSGHLPGRFESFADSKRRLCTDFCAHKRHIAATWFKDGVQHDDFHLLQQCADRVALPTAEKALDAMAAFDVSDQLARLAPPALPCLIISAEHDRTYSLACQRQLQQRLPGADWQLMSNCAHCAHLEDKPRFVAIMRQWQQRLATATGISTR